MNTLEIIFGVISSIGILVGIYYTIKDNKQKDKLNILKQNDKLIIIKPDNKQTTINQINTTKLQSDKDLRDSIYNEMANLSLIHADFENFSKKFIGTTVNWLIKIAKIDKVDNKNYKIYFETSIYSRLEYMIINPIEFPIVNFIKKNENYNIEAKIKEFGETILVLDTVLSLNKIEE